jgi:hypothetical protein
MVSSNRFGGRGTTAGSRVEIGSTGETEAGTLFPTEEETGRRRQNQLLPHYVPDIDMRGALQQRVEIGIVSRLRVAAEHRRVNIDIHFRPHLGQTAATFAFYLGVDGAAPEIFSFAGFLQLSVYRYRTNQIQIETFKRRIVWPELPNGPYRASLEVPYVDSQHSRLK